MTNAKDQRAWRDRQRGGPPRPRPADQPCGTEAKARWHRRQGLDGRKLRDVCPDCGAAEAEASKLRKRNR